MVIKNPILKGGCAKQIRNNNRFFLKYYKDILIKNNFNQYINLLKENNLTVIITISEICEYDLEKLGITIMGDRKEIIKLFKLT